MSLSNANAPSSSSSSSPATPDLSAPATAPPAPPAALTVTVEMLVHMAASRTSRNVGDEVEVSEREAGSLVLAGFAKVKGREEKRRLLRGVQDLADARAAKLEGQTEQDRNALAAIKNPAGL
jgi:hypothetical protein